MPAMHGTMATSQDRVGLTPSTVGHGPVPMACAEAVECPAVLLPTLQALSTVKSKNNAPFCPGSSEVAAELHVLLNGAPVRTAACSRRNRQQPCLRK